MAVQPPIRWIVPPAPTGTFRSFHRRSWPMAFIGDPNGPVAFALDCKDAYVPARVRTGDHGPIKLRMADRRDHRVGWTWRTFKAEFKAMEDAKAFAAKFYKDHPEIFTNTPDTALKH